MPLVAGVDCSTQATKVLVCDSADGRVLRSGQAPHPDGTEVHPESWLAAFHQASDGLLDGVEAIGVAGQQHGLVTLDGGGEVVRPALLWNDVRSAGAASALVAEMGGPSAWAEAVGSVPVASFTVTKLRWMAEHEPDLAARVAQVLLPHDWLTWKWLRSGVRTGGAPTGRDVEPVTDRGDASGTGYFSPAANEYREDVLRLAFGRAPGLPRVLAPSAPAGETPDGVLVSAGTGDNMGAALGLGLAPGDMVVSLGTSGTAFAVSRRPSADASGAVAGFADATGRFLPLVCTLNAARVLDATARLLGVDHAGLDSLALAAPPGADGLVMVPYLDGERTPDVPDATGLLAGMTRRSMTPQNLARAAVEGMLCSLADGVDALRAQGVEPRRALLVGGGSRSAAVQAVAPAVFGVPVVVPPAAEYVALGAARQAAWALAGGAEPPNWAAPEASDDAVSSTATVDRSPDEGHKTPVRDRYAQVRDFLLSQKKVPLSSS